MIENPNKPGIKGNFLNLIKGTNEKPRANVTLNGEKSTFLLISEKRKRRPFLPLLFNIVKLEVLASAVS